jgi:hypothetical protein
MRFGLAEIVADMLANVQPAPQAAPEAKLLVSSLQVA